jgi:hypothetical protein
MSLQILKQYQDVASTSEITTPPNLFTNYRKEANPYLASKVWSSVMEEGD